jgi:hypothetical protein
MKIEIYPTYGGRTKRPRKPKIIGQLPPENGGGEIMGKIVLAWNWRAVASNGKIVAASTQGYERVSDARAAFSRFYNHLPSSMRIVVLK